MQTWAGLAAKPDRSWYDDFWERGKVMRHTLNISGGSERVTFFAGGNYYNEKGNFGGIEVDKYSIRAGMDAKITVDFTANLSFSSGAIQKKRNTKRLKSKLMTSLSGLCTLPPNGLLLPLMVPQHTGTGLILRAIGAWRAFSIQVTTPGVNHKA